MLFTRNELRILAHINTQGGSADDMAGIYCKNVGTFKVHLSRIRKKIAPLEILSYDLSRHRAAGRCPQFYYTRDEDKIKIMSLVSNRKGKP